MSHSPPPPPPLIPHLLSLTFLLISLLICPSSSLPNFLCGASTEANAPQQTLSLLKSHHMTHNRIYAAWRYVQPGEMLFDLPRYLPGHPTANISWRTVREVLKNDRKALRNWMNAPERNWSMLDDVVKRSLDLSMEPIIEIGEGTWWCLPQFNKTKYSMDPNEIGKTKYLTYMYAFSRAVVMRYSGEESRRMFGRRVATRSAGDDANNLLDDQPAITLYQIENELNEAYFSSLIGWRKFKLLGNVWNDWDFLTELMEMLHTAVKDECETCLATQNLHTDLSAEVHRLTFVHGFYLDAIRNWHSYMDFISFDSYPNYYVSQPLLPEVLGDKVAAIREVLKDLGEDQKKVIVMETGYAVSNLTSDLPASLNFTQEHQYEWIHRAVQSIIKAGGDGILYFNAVKSPGVTAPPGGYTTQDAKAMEMLARLSSESDVLAAIEWLSHPSNWSYLKDRMPILAGSIEAGWGLLEMDGTPRLGLKAMGEVCAAAENLVKQREEGKMERDLSRRDNTSQES